MVGYGIKYKCEFQSLKGLDYKVYILQKGYNSAVYDLRMGGNPIQINYTNSSENKFEIIRGSECILNFFSEYDGQFSEIMYADKNDFLVQVLLNDDLHWQGYVIQDNYSEPFASAPYQMSLRATDGLGDLKLFDFSKDDGTVFLSNMTFAEAILNCLAQLKNGTQLVTSNNVFELRIDRNLASNEAFNQLTVNPFIFLKDELNAKKCSEVLKMILELFQCYIYYKKGKYYIERISYKLSDVLTRRTYNINFNGEQSITNAVTTENIRGVIERDGYLSFINNDHNSTFVSAYNKVVVDNNSIDPSNLVVNNYFRFWNSDDTAPINWDKLGTLSIAKKEYLGEGDALQITTKANDNEISYSTNMLSAGETAYNGSLSIVSSDELTVTLAYKGNVRIMVRVESTRPSQYLSTTGYTENGEVTFESSFTSTPSTCKIKNNPYVTTNNWAVATLKAKIPSYARSIDIAVLPSFNTAEYSGECHIRELTPKITAGEGARAEGFNYKITSNKNVRESYDEFSPVLGEFNTFGVLNQLFINTPDGRVNTLYWNRDGKTENKSLLHIGVQSILNQYRTPFRLFSGTFLGEFDYSKVYEIETLGGVYMPYKASSDLKFDTHKVDFFELLPDTDAESDKYVRLLKYKDGRFTNFNQVISAGTPRPSRG